MEEQKIKLSADGKSIEVPKECEHKNLHMINRNERRSKEYVKNYGKEIYHAYCRDCQCLLKKKTNG